MAHRPLVSILMPAYKVEPYIGQAIESVLAQTMPDWELIIVDDCSPDNTAQVVERYLSDPRIKFLQNERNSGAGYTRNRAMDAATGEWIAVLDADDWYEPNRLERLIYSAEAENADMVADLQRLIDDTTRQVIGISGGGKLVVPQEPCWITAEQALRGHIAVKHIVRRSFLREKAIRYAEQILRSQDFVFVIEILIKGARFLLIPEPLYNYRVRPETITSRYAHDIHQFKLAHDYLIQLPETSVEQKLLIEAWYNDRRRTILTSLFGKAIRRRNLRDMVRLLAADWQVFPRWFIQGLQRRLIARLRSSVFSRGSL